MSERMYEKQVEPLRWKTAEQLLSEPMETIAFHIPQLLPQGTHLLCGAPKVGKSWMALWLAVQIASGEPVWGLQTNPCGVLYFCLEDTEARVKERLYRITDEAPESLHIAVQCNRLRDGFEEQIETYLMLHPDTKIVIVDTLQKIRADRFDNSLYRADYADIGAVKEIADRLSITFILVHHLRKMPDDTDPFNMISGSNGLSGAVDGMFLLSKDKRTENSARFIATGRDIEMQQFRLAFENCKWHVLEMSETEQLKEDIPPVLDSVIEFINEKRVWYGTSTELCAELKARNVDARPTTITKQLGKYAESYLKEHYVGYVTTRSKFERQIGLFHARTPEEMQDDDLPFDDPTED